MLELKLLSKLYNQDDKNAFKAVNCVDLILPSKGMVFVVGKSGSGKTTLLNLMAGLDKQTTGEILYDGNRIGEDIDYSTYCNEHVSYVFQKFNLIKEWTVYENVIMPLKIQNKTIEKEKIDNVLLSLGLLDKKYKKINQLSGGEEQRTAVARALVKESNIIFADEPTANLDSAKSRELLEILKDISKEILVVVVTHNMKFPMNYGDRIVEMKDGKIIRNQSKSDSDDSIVLNEGALTEDNLELINSNIKRNFRLKGKVAFADSVETIKSEKVNYEKSSSKKPTNIMKMVGKNLWAEKFKNITFTVVLVLCFALFGVTLLINNYSQPISNARNFKITKENSLVIIPNNTDRLTNDVIDSINDNSDKLNPIYLRQLNGFKFISNEIVNEEMFPTDINGVYEISENKLKLLNFKLMNFEEKDGQKAINSRFPLTGGKVKTENGMEANEIVITDYLAYVLYRHLFGEQDFTNPSEGKLNSLEEFLSSGFERFLLDFEVLLMVPNYIRVVGILDTGYKTKYTDIIKSGILDNSSTALNFLNDINSYYKYLYSGEGFAKSCYAFNLEVKDSHYITKDSAIYEKILKQNKLTQLFSFDGVLKENEIILTERQFSNLLGSDFDVNSEGYIADIELDNFTLKNAKIVGVIDNIENFFKGNKGMIISPQLMQRVAEANSFVIGARVSVNDDGQSVFDMIDKHNLDYISTQSVLIGELQARAENLKDIMVPIMIITLIIGVILMGVYIVVSIEKKQVQYGIFRANGCKRSDGIAIFFIEAALKIAVIAILAIVFISIIFTVFNNIMIVEMQKTINAEIGKFVLYYSTVAPYFIAFWTIVAVGILSAAVPLMRLRKLTAIEAIGRVS